jgi:hypothetical protein
MPDQPGERRDRQRVESPTSAPKTARYRYFSFFGYQETKALARLLVKLRYLSSFPTLTISESHLNDF